MAKQELQTVIADLKLTVDATFVPWSKSRGFKPDAKTTERTLNWRVSLKVDGREILSTDYSAGCAHCPSYRQGRLTLDVAEAIERETEHGRAYRGDFVRGKPILPDALDVVYSLVSEAEALNYRDFADWADSFGYNSDSIKAEKAYQACLGIGLALRNSIGEAGLARLQEAVQDY